MRDLGYSLETAVADLIDNSISAAATEIEIFCAPAVADPALAIIDNGGGMDSDGLIAAMRHGVGNPRQPRAPGDLGRFGLGLKTASFSQCRRLTVITARKGARSAAEWNLDLVDKRDDWIISIPDPEEIDGMPFVDHLPATGTIVIWRSLDRLFEDETGSRRDEIVNEKLDIVEKHLALVFHRFLSSEVKGRKKLSIRINGHMVDPFDPFCRKNTNTQVMPEEVVRVGGVPVHMQPYILPHHSKLSAREYDFYQNRSDFISNQGAYVYRNGRLMAWGDWFRLIPKGEATKLARVQIDFPSSLDEAWTIDIKKSRARPPLAVRERLRQIIARISNRSTTVHRGRGQRLFEEISAPVWERFADHGQIRYALNRSHPLVQALVERLEPAERTRLDLLLEGIGSSLPVEMIYSDYSTNPREVQQQAVEESEVLERLRLLREHLFNGSKPDPDGFREVLRSLRLFDRHPEITERFIREELE
jgi:hypothetical protein